MSPERGREELEVEIDDLEREIREIELLSWRLRVYKANMMATELKVFNAMCDGLLR